jgi:hypothetical protein
MTIPRLPARAPRRTGWTGLPLALAASGLLVCDTGVRAQDAGVPAPSATAAAGDARWAPWVGCWVPEDGTPPDEQPPAPAVLVCVTPAGGPTGAVIRTFVNGRVFLEDRIAADGQRHPPREDGCHGWQLEEWSSSGQRVFTSAESTCAEDRVVRLSGLTTITPDDRWVDVQAVTVGGRTGMRVRSFQRALGPLPAELTDQVRPPRRRVGPMTLDEVKEASAKVSPFVLEAAVAETRVEFTASAKTVVALADAGVSSRVIDLIVALDFPKRFVIMRARPERPWTRAGLRVEQVGPTVAGAYAPFAYFYAYGDEFWDEPGFIDLDPGPPSDGGGGGGGAEYSQGRLVKGLGYTRVETRPSSPPGGHSDRSSGSAEGSRGDASDAASPQGYSSGASGDTGRTAQPRPPQ